MASSSNRLQIKGHIGSIRTFGVDQSAFTLISICTSEYMGKNEDGSIKTIDTWFKVRAYGRNHKRIGTSGIKVGDYVEFTGSMKQFRYKDKQGNVKYNLDTVMSDMLVLNRKEIAA